MSYHIVSIDSPQCSLSCRDGQLTCKTAEGERNFRWRMSRPSSSPVFRPASTANFFWKRPSTASRSSSAKRSSRSAWCCRPTAPRTRFFPAPCSISRHAHGRICGKRRLMPNARTNSRWRNISRPRQGAGGIARNGLWQKTAQGGHLRQNVLADFRRGR